MFCRLVVNCVDASIHFVRFRICILPRCVVFFDATTADLMSGRFTLLDKCGILVEPSDGISGPVPLNLPLLREERCVRCYERSGR
jgi:hypothetical protein